MPPARGLLYIATASAIALMVRSVVVGPVPIWMAATALGLYALLILAGVFVLRLGVFVDVTWRGPRDARGVALTFDDGPSPLHTPKILEILDRAGVKATFFLIGRKVEAHPELVRDIAARGHAIGVHGYVHNRLYSLMSAEAVRLDLARALEVVEKVTGEAPRLFRPPIGHTSARVARALRDFDVEVIGWSARGFDGAKRVSAERVARRVVPKLRDGAIVLLHDAAEREDRAPVSVEALPQILAAMERLNLPGVRVDAWLPDAED